MKKSDLEFGNVVELRKGDKLLVFYSLSGEKLISLIGCGYTMMDSYHENLKDIDGLNEFDIMKVYKDYTCKELLWERKEKPQLNEDEKAILKVLLNEKYKWIARDKNDWLYVYASKPKKGITIWENTGSPMMPFIHLFNFIKWEDDEPYSIEDLLEGENDF